MGFDVVTREFEKLGFEVRHSIVSARQLGAHHNRKRLFIVASRSFTHLEKKSVNLSHEFSWENSYIPKLIECTDPSTRKSIRNRCGASGNAIVPYCLVKAFKWMVFSEKIEDKTIHLNLCLVDGETRYNKQVWATPCAAPRTYYKYDKLSKRSSTLLYNQLFFEQQNNKSVLTHTINPQFVEWMMGYPVNYTNI